MYCNVDSIPDNIICQRDAMDCFSTQLSRIIGIANGDTTLVGMERIRDIIEKMYSKICYKTLRSSGVEIELYHFFMIAVAEKFGFTATHIDASSIKKCIDDKVAVIVPINVETTTGSVGAHQVQITGYQNE